MDNQNYDVRELLQYIDPSTLNYQEWVNVGMALKDGGYSAMDWDDWSRPDSRWHKNECFKKWGSFQGSSTPVTVGTIVQMAKDNGWEPPHKGGMDMPLAWDAVIGGKDDLVVVDAGWVEGKSVSEPKNWNPVNDLTKYLETLFDSTENVGYVTKTWEKDGKHMPTKGHWDRTAGELIQELNKCNGDVGAVIGDYNQEAGAWIRFNPLDGNGVNNDNVTEFKYALVESDRIDVDKQNALLRELELPIATLVHSGKKSLHAIVKIDAADYGEYRKRVEYLYAVCAKNGLAVDTQNKNPSRLSRMPGIMRNGQKQFLIDTNIGKENWAEWKEWIEGVNDDLPDPENLADVWDDLPELSPPLIDGVLRQGHKMLLAGPSKAGKSFALIEMCIAIAEGCKWLNWQCTRGKVLYVNLELDRASCLHRFKDVYNALGWQPDNLSNVEIWNLRGKSVPMDKLAPKLIRRAYKKDFIAIIIDPIYKVITGDENSADQMAHFCNQFDKVCTDLGCAVIYCHHHSKGTQGNKKSMDRASGSGVFARDPDALLDLIELELTEDLIAQQINKAACNTYIEWMDKYIPDLEDHVSQDDMCSQSVLAEKARKLMPAQAYKDMQPALFKAEKQVRQRTGWRIDGTLREFPKFEPVNVWFDYPVHRVDEIGCLNDIAEDGEGAPWQKAIKKRSEGAKKTNSDIVTKFKNAYDFCSMDERPTLIELADYLNKPERTVRDWMKKAGYKIDKNIGKVIKEETE